MLLNDANAGDQLSIRVTGYQFPDAPDPAQRFSWHMVAGQVRCGQGSWQFHWQALTCDESPRVSAWLRTAAESAQLGHRSPGPLAFVEPNLALRATSGGAGQVDVEVDFDLEFQPPWNRHRHAADPFTLSFTTTPDQLREAARQWDVERASFPDGLSCRARTTSPRW